MLASNILCLVMCWCVGVRVCTWADNACIEDRKVLFAGGEWRDGEGAAGLGATAHPPLHWRTRTLSSCTQGKYSYSIIKFF